MTHHALADVSDEEMLGVISLDRWWAQKLLEAPSGRGCHVTGVSLFHVWQHKVYLVPAARFTMDFIEPKVHCISVHGTFSSNR